MEAVSKEEKEIKGEVLFTDGALPTLSKGL